MAESRHPVCGMEDRDDDVCERMSVRFEEGEGGLGRDKLAGGRV